MGSTALILGGLALAGGIAVAAAGGGKDTDTNTVPIPTPTPPQPLPSYSVAASATSVDEGKSITFTITDANKVAGQKVTWSVNPERAGDIEGPTSGEVTIDQTGKATVTIAVKEDATTETAAESLTFTVGSQSVSATINDTSKTPAPAAKTLQLTAGIDKGAAFTGAATDDTFIANTAAGALALTTLDEIDGGAGNDTLTATVIGALNTTTATGVVVKGIESATLTSDLGVTTNTTAWDGLTSLTVVGADDSAITAAATTDVVVKLSALSAAAGTELAIDGGKTVTSTSADSLTLAGAPSDGAIVVGGTTAAAGAVSVTHTETASATADTVATTGSGTTINVTGGTSITVVSNAVVGAADNDGDAFTIGAIGVTGDASTASVSVTQTAAAAYSADAGKIAIVNGAVTIADKNAASTTVAGTLASVTLANYGNSTIDSSALTTVTLSGKGGTLGIGRGALTATPTANTLDLKVSGLTGGAITDSEAGADDGFTTINIASSTTASTIADLIAGDVTALNISGDAKLTLTAQTLGAVKTITVTNSAGVTLGTELATGVTFTGGAGADTIGLGATTKAIDMGAGNDVVVLSSNVLGAGGSLKGGDGVDTLVANTNTSSFIADPAFSGFETLRVAGLAAQGSHNANGFTALEVGTLAAAATFTNVASGVGLTVLAAPGFGTTVTLANATGTADTFALTLKSAATMAANSISLAGVETVNITNTDTTPTAAGALDNTNTLTLVATSATTVSVTGNAGLNLTNTGNVAIKTFDASGVTGASTDAAALAVTFVSENTTVGENITIKGGSGNDILTGGAVTNDTISGGAGADTITYNGGSDTFTGGAGADTFVSGATGTSTAYMTITDATVGDKIDFVGVGTATFGATKVSLGAGATFAQYLAAASDQNGSANSKVEWFQFDGNTYVVMSNDDGTGGATAGFTSGTDVLIKLTGLVDLSTSTLNGAVTNIFTIA